MKRHVQQILLYVGVMVGAILAGFFFVQAAFIFHTPDSPLIDIHTEAPPPITTMMTPSPTDQTAKNIAVPFTPQAPLGVWDSLHEEMCEEAAVVMANAWETGAKLSGPDVEIQLQKLAQWEVGKFGYYTDTSAKQTAQMAQAVYNLHTRLVANPTADEIKAILDTGDIVLVGMAGQTLRNPNYTPPGPVYHMLVVRGYDKAGFFTNDDGTRNGNNYHYDFSTFMAAAHDWPGGGEGLASSSPVAIVVSKE